MFCPLKTIFSGFGVWSPFLFFCQNYNFESYPSHKLKFPIPVLSLPHPTPFVPLQVAWKAVWLSVELLTIVESTHIIDG